jgi:hypothetical protein
MQVARYWRLKQQLYTLMIEVDDDKLDVTPVEAFTKTEAEKAAEVVQPAPKQTEKLPIVA